MTDPGIQLRALLADPTQCGAYFIDVRERDAMAAAATALAFASIPIVLDGCRDKDAVLARFAATLQFPDWFGRNWDALADCLGDMSWWPADGYVLLLDGIDAWRTQEGEDFATLVDILDDAARGWAAQRIAFWALMPLPADALATIES